MKGGGTLDPELCMAGSIWLPSCNTVGRDAAGMVQRCLNTERGWLVGVARPYLLL